MSPKKKKNGSEPATQKDLSLLGGQLTTTLNEINKNMATKADLKQVASKVNKLDSKVEKLDSKVDKLDSRVDRLESSQKAILKVLHSIDEQLKEHKTHPARIARLERSVFKH